MPIDTITIYRRNGTEYRSLESMLDSIHVDIDRILFANDGLGPKAHLNLMKRIEANAAKLRRILEDLEAFQAIEKS